MASCVPLELTVQIKNFIKFGTFVFDGRLPKKKFPRPRIIFSNLQKKIPLVLKL